MYIPLDLYAIFVSCPGQEDDPFPSQRPSPPLFLGTHMKSGLKRHKDVICEISSFESYVPSFVKDTFIVKPLTSYIE